MSHPYFASPAPAPADTAHQGAGDESPADAAGWDITYTLPHRAWYAPALQPGQTPPRLIRVQRHDGGRTLWVINIQEMPGGLEMGCDVGPTGLSGWGDLACILGGANAVSLRGIEAALRAWGAKDETPRVSPYPPMPPVPPTAADLRQ